MKGTSLEKTDMHNKCIWYYKAAVTLDLGEKMEMYPVSKLGHIYARFLKYGLAL